MQKYNNFLIKQYSEEEDPDFYAFYNKPITAIIVQSLDKVEIISINYMQVAEVRKHLQTLH